MKIIPRPSAQRGYADHTWLKTYHSFSFANYYDQRYTQYGPLRVINEDKVAPENGFGTHPHRNFEIWTYVLGGELTHTDSLGNREVMREGDVQYTSAGTGITHSEWNYHKEKPAHILQIWAKPDEEETTPQYYTRHFKKEEKHNTLRPIIRPAADYPAGYKHKLQDPTSSEPIPIPTTLAMYACLLQPGQTVRHTFQNPKGYIHMAMSSHFKDPKEKSGANSGKLTLQDGTNEAQYITEGDGAFVEIDQSAGKSTVLELTSSGDAPAHFLLFDMQ